MVTIQAKQIYKVEEELDFTTDEQPGGAKAPW